MNKQKNKKRFFIYSPASYGIKNRATGEYISKSLRTNQNPFYPDEDRPWRRNIYYFWWEFLRRHEGYKDCCERGGAGRYKRLYADWGNIHTYENFWMWWSEEVETTELRGQYLFAEPLEYRQVKEVHDLKSQTEDDLIVSIPMEVRTGELTKSLRRLLKQNTERSRAARAKSRAKYPVSASVPLMALHKTLQVYDLLKEHNEALRLRNKHPNKIFKYQIADMAGLDYNDKWDGKSLTYWRRQAESGTAEDNYYFTEAQNTVRTRMTQAVNRYEKAAYDYLSNVADGKFPLRCK
jgi:hypothetical protein